MRATNGPAEALRSPTETTSGGRDREHAVGGTEGTSRAHGPGRRRRPARTTESSFRRSTHISPRSPGQRPPAFNRRTSGRTSATEEVQERDRAVGSDDLDRPVELHHRHPVAGRGDGVALAGVGLLAHQQLVTGGRQVAGSTTDGRPGGAVTGSPGVIVMVSSVVSRAGRCRRTRRPAGSPGQTRRPAGTHRPSARPAPCRPARSEPVRAVSVPPARRGTGSTGAVYSAPPTVNPVTAPPPALRKANAAPPCASATSRTIERPSPEPGRERASAAR